MNKRQLQNKLKYENNCYINKYGEGYVITEYIDNNNVRIKFHNGYEKISKLASMKFNNKNHSPYARTVYNQGYIGEGEFNSKSIYYHYWLNMYTRCYDEEYHKIQPSYIGCFVNEELDCFQDFGYWAKWNYYEVPGEKMQLDKDILFKNNKEYSFTTIIFVPQRINSLFTKANSIRGEYPIGITRDGNKLRVRCNILIDEKMKNIELGRFDLDEEELAFEAYKNFKEDYIKQVADEYYNLIPRELWKAMYEYEVEIDD